MQHGSEFRKQRDWDTVILPKTSFLHFNFREIWRYRDLLILFVRRDFVAQYKQTVLGVLWHFIQPLFTTLIFLVIFGKIANIPTDGIEPMLFFMSGITVWNYFSACLTSTSSTFVTNASVFGKVYFPRLVLPLSNIISNLIRFLIQFLLLFLLMIYFGFKTGNFYIGYSWLLMPVFVLMMAGLGLGLGIIISSLSTKYRDFNILVSFGLQLLMYAAPVAYPLSFLKGKTYAAWISWNPLTPILEGFRYALFNKGTVEIAPLIWSVIFIVVILFLGVLFFNRVEKTFMDTV